MCAHLRDKGVGHPRHVPLLAVEIPVEEGTNTMEVDLREVEKFEIDLKRTK